MRNGESENGQFIAVVCADRSGVFSANMLRFETAEAAREYASDLSYRWTAVRAYAVIPYGIPKDVSGSYWSRATIEANAIGGIREY